jgi:hypothetical protein
VQALFGCTTFDGHSIKILYQLGQALAFIIPADEYFDTQLGARLLKESFCCYVLEKISKRCGAKRCQCIACLFRHMLCLPPEILSYHILPYVKQTYIRQILPAHGEISGVISLLQDYPARTWNILCKDAVFQTRINFGKVSYLTGLFNRMISCSKVIKTWSEKPRYIVVWLDKIGIIDINFLPSAEVHDSVQSKHTWVYAFPFTETIQVKSKVCRMQSYIFRILTYAHTRAFS